MMPIKQGTNLTAVLTQLAGYITITDNVDGHIPFELSMIDFGGLNDTNAQPGVYEIKISTKDLGQRFQCCYSGNHRLTMKHRN